ncbi:MAG: lipase family protein [Bacteroidales bacterium]|nr:lipase family protein [Bacteroidales bacterium]
MKKSWRKYTLDWKELFRPGSFREFDLMVDYPVERVYAHQRSREKTLFLMELCRLSYIRDCELRQNVLAKIALKEEQFYSNKGSQFMILQNLADAPVDKIIVFRGTDDIFDYRNIFTFGSTPWPGGGTIYKGFNRSFQAIQGVIREIATDLKDQSVWIIGHSLGGILAVLSSIYFKDTELTIFGMPKLGDRDFYSSLKNPVSYYHTRRDFIQSMPILIRKFYLPESQIIPAREIKNRTCPSLLYVHAPISYSHNIRVAEHGEMFGEMEVGGLKSGG